MDIEISWVYVLYAFQYISIIRSLIKYVLWEEMFIFFPATDLHQIYPSCLKEARTIWDKVIGYGKYFFQTLFGQYLID